MGAGRSEAEILGRTEHERVHSRTSRRTCSWSTGLARCRWIARPEFQSSELNGPADVSWGESHVPIYGRHATFDAGIGDSVLMSGRQAVDYRARVDGAQRLADRLRPLRRDSTPPDARTAVAEGVDADAGAAHRVASTPAPGVRRCRSWRFHRVRTGTTSSAA